MKTNLDYFRAGLRDTGRRFLTGWMVALLVAVAFAALQLAFGLSEDTMADLFGVVVVGFIAWCFRRRLAAAWRAVRASSGSSTSTLGYNGPSTGEASPVLMVSAVSPAASRRARRFVRLVLIAAGGFLGLWVALRAIHWAWVTPIFGS